MTQPHSKIRVTSKSPVGDISVVTLIRTDTTLDHSQKAEKVCSDQGLVNARPFRGERDAAKTGTFAAMMQGIAHERQS